MNHAHTSVRLETIAASRLSPNAPAEIPDRPLPLFRRLIFLVILFSLEIILISCWLDTGTLRRTAGLTGAVSQWGSPAIRSIVAMAVVFGGLFFLKCKTALAEASDACSQTGIGWDFLIGHVVAMAAFCMLSAHLFADTSAAARVDLNSLLWLMCGGVAAASGVFAFLPPALCSRLVRGSGNTWIYASIAGLLVNPLARAVDRLWNPTAGLTFQLVRLCLHPFFRDLIVNPATRVIGTRNFRVYISGQCSGLEGAGLMLLFGAFWLWFLRDELRFPRAFLVLPAGVAILFLLNTLRIAALLVIGNAGAKAVAAGGFHSQAGWIAFNAVSLGLLMGVRYVPWLTQTSPQKSDSVWADNPAAPYLIPFLAILAAGMISRAASARFEWFYPLRFLAAGASLWVYRRKYRELDWRFGWLAISVGATAFAAWILLHRLVAIQPDNGIAAGLRAAASPVAAAWLSFRVLAAVLTVPVAEELAYRAFLIRWIAPYLQSLGVRTAMAVSITVSSLAFGVMHGSNWIAGMLVGVLYAAAFLRRGRIGDAVAAHATTNALLAAWVLVYRDWSFW